MKIAALFFTLLVGVSASTGARSRVSTLHPSSSIALTGGYGRLVADGPRAAAVGPCGFVRWTRGARKGAFLQPCRSAKGVDFSGVDEVALAGNRLAWMREEWISHGLVVQTELVVKTGSGKPREIADAYNDNSEGGWLLTLAGAGCPHSSEGLLPTPPPAYVCIDTGADYGSVRSVSSGRILVSLGDALALVDPDNTVHDLPIPYTEDSDQVALSGAEIVLIHPGGTTLNLYDAASGSLAHRWPIPRAVHLGKLSVAGDLAVYSSRGIHLVNLRTGSRRTILAPGGKPPIAATIEPGGVYFLYRTKRGERLGFAPVKT